MEYNKIIEAIERDCQLKIHFTGYDFGEVLKINCPRPDYASFLRKDYFRLMNGLKEFLKTEPARQSIDIFIIDAIKGLDTSKYLEVELKLLMLKFNGFNYFSMGTDIVKRYFDHNKENLMYAIQPEPEKND